MTGPIRTLLMVAALVAATPVAAQRLSLGERVTALEQKAAAQSQGTGQANIDLLNRLTELQGELQSLRNQVEQLQRENEQLKQRGREQYLDLDGRLQRLEGGGATPSPAGAANPAVAPAATVAAEPAPVGPTPAAPTPAPAPANPADEAAAYGAAFDFLKRGDYVESARAFKDFLQRYPQASLAPNAWYWLGESYYVTQNYPVAQDAFDQLLAQFPSSGKAPDALLKRGFCQLEMKQFEQGQRTLADLIERYPASDAARLAQSRLRGLSLENR